MSSENVTVRYTDEDLIDFKSVIDSKLEKAMAQYQSLKEQLKDITENNTDDFAKDITDFSSIQSEIEMLNNMANHQRKYIQDLENALIRINNKSYGICVVSGELIDKKRLLAVPTTTKSVTAKTQSEMKDKMIVPKEKIRGFDDELELDDEKPVKKSEPKSPVIITKVIKKSPGTKPVSPLDDEDLDKIFSELDVIKELDESELNIEDDDEEIGYDSEEDLDMIADEDSYDEDEDME
ncbi:MAG: TraR/DksA family transcriptional regulator [Saprospiraceae bacterium]|nr:TraR/DksA family transcriptional regulator [Saprospiraceae bacterium]MBK6563857.1 TraR/DksA family transcriptional regulator [Saprospiraceae bacterium]MBK6785820.1 TraR/DksA family transcriptional regulator [Saprospiraceae bacterium]MBK7525482.1 TraR/DksA family transcriptional regulator [Saprospiraceae bacterium]MBK8817774.1 TraR/DksA family transcriptional regulator [Saprospiraceae bacterium]